jgi:hypothetical protein
MARRVFIGQDFEGYNSVVGADDDNVLDQLLDESVAGDDMEIVGADEEIVGADEEIVGADVQARPSNKNKLVYDQYLPLTVAAGVSIAAGASHEVELKPQRLFRPDQLTVSEAAEVLDLTAFSIGQENQFVAGGGIPCEFFAKDAVAKKLTSQTAGPGTTILMTFTNPTGGAVILKGGWVGKSVVR